MAIFGKKNKQNQALPYVDGLYPASPDDAVSNAVANATQTTLTGEVVYVNPLVEDVLKGKNKKTEKKSPKISEGLWLMDIAQSHHFTVWLDKMDMSNLKLPEGTYSKDRGFLPVKSMNLKYTSYENMNIPVAIFGDFPLLNKKRVSTIDLSCYDYDNNKLEYELRQWEAQCFPKGRYVAYMSDIAREFRYRGYNVKGQQTLEYRVFVIPAGNVSVSRDTSANDAKMVNFSLVVVGDGQTCASGNGNDPGIVWLEPGAGPNTKIGAYLDARVTGAGYNY